MKQFINILKVAAFLMVLLFLCGLMIHCCSCRSKEEKYFQLKYPGCVIDVVDRSSIFTKVRVHCPYEEPKIIKVRSN